MYSGTTLKRMRRFDARFGAHQKIDRVARRHLNRLPGNVHFPTAKQILEFEGLDGPDGIKRKTPAQDEPWHFYDPTDTADTKIIDLIELHYCSLVTALKADNEARAAFEAAWLAHAIVDGLTPAHHYPYEAELKKLRGGEGIETRTSMKEKIIMHGDTLPMRLRNNWKMWGDKGLAATHFAFEWGICAIIMPLRFRKFEPTASELQRAEHKNCGDMFREQAQRIAELGMYEAFYKSGWTPRLAKQVRRELVPMIITAVTLAWHAAEREASEATVS